MSSGVPYDGGATRPAIAIDARGSARRRRSIDDLFLPDEARLDDRTRAAVHATLAAIVRAIEAEVRLEASRLLAERGLSAEAEAIGHGEPVLARLTRSGVLRDPELADELIARVELDLLGRALPPVAAEPRRPSLLVRLAESPDEFVASAAAALLAAENRHRDDEGADGGGLPAELRQRLTWWVAAALRDPAPGAPAATDRDHALEQAALRCLGAHDEGDRPEAAAVRLAIALDARDEELPDLLSEVLGDRRAILFTALLARAASIDYDQVRQLVVEPTGGSLLFLLRATGLPGSALARIALTLAEADPRRDLEALADLVEQAVGSDRASLREMFVPLTLRRDFRAAVGALEDVR